MCRRLCITLPLFLLAGWLVTACSDHDRISPAQASAFEQVAQTVARQDDRVRVDELARWFIEGRKDYVLIDLRPAADFDKAHIEGAQNLTLTQLVTPTQLATLPADRKVIVYSQGSEVAAQAVVLLRLVGYNASLLLGGYNFWARHVLNPDISPTLADGEYPRVPEQQAIACYFVGGNQVQQAPVQPRKPAFPPFVPPYSNSTAPPARPPGAKKEHC